jgi:hypothetical protein
MSQGRKSPWSRRFIVGADGAVYRLDTDCADIPRSRPRGAEANLPRSGGSVKRLR